MPADAIPRRRFPIAAAVRLLAWMLCGCWVLLLTCYVVLVWRQPESGLALAVIFAVAPSALLAGAILAHSVSEFAAAAEALLRRD